MSLLNLADRTLTLHRYPRRDRDPLQAWDAADEYLLKHLAAEKSPPGDRSLLIVGDAFGTLTAALHGHRPVCWNDSHLAEKGLAANLETNGLAADQVAFVPADQELQGSFDLVLLKVPKSLAHLEDILLRLRPVLNPAATVIAGSMIKHTPASVYRLLEKCIGPTKTSLGWKKARLAVAAFDPERDLPPRVPDYTYDVEEFGWTMANSPNLFSRERFDPGARLLMAHLPRIDAPAAMADLGCGNGVLTLALAARCPAADILGVDASYQAVSCAEKNMRNNGMADSRVKFAVADGLVDVAPGTLDAVVCNPPFHQAQTVGDHLAVRMFEQARTSLKRGGELRVVGNRHLGYHVKLRLIFGSCEVLASDRKFVVLRSVRA